MRIFTSLLLSIGVLTAGFASFTPAAQAQAYYNPYSYYPYGGSVYGSYYGGAYARPYYPMIGSSYYRPVTVLRTTRMVSPWTGGYYGGYPQYWGGYWY